MKFYSFFIVLYFTIVVLGSTNYPYPVPVPRNTNSWTIGQVGNGTIYYQQNDFYSFGNVKNPVTVFISYSNGANFVSNICLNSFAQKYPISGVNLQSTCPNGGYGEISNNTLTNGATFQSPPDDAVDDTTSAQIYVKPGSDVGFVVTLPDATVKQNFTIGWEAHHCSDLDLYPIGSNGQCLPISEIDSTQIITIGAGTWAYFRITTPTYSNTFSNSFNVSVNGTTDGIEMYVQEGYIPTQDWYLNTDNELDDNNNLHAAVITPATTTTSETFFVGIFNSNEGTRTVSLNHTFVSCGNTTNFGYDCRHTPSNTTAVGGVRTISTTITKGNNSLTSNNGSALSYDYSAEGYEHDYAYFALTNYPNYALPYYIRVSVGNNQITDLSGAPSLFAKLGGYPSEQSNHYNVSTFGDVAHQITIPVTSELLGSQETWYIAVKLPSDFSIWVGTNCANNCSNGDHGDCMCDSVPCTSINQNRTDPEVYYRLPSVLQDSGGACTCNNDKYDFSYIVLKKIMEIVLFIYY